MKKLNKYPLHFKPAKEYVVGELEDVNILSSQLLNLLNFDNGKFFVLLPHNANLEDLYNFKNGGILQQFPKEKQFINGRLSTYSWIPDINIELSELILKEIESRKNLCCMIDKVTGEASETCYKTYFQANPLFYDNEVYFLIQKENASNDLILKCLKASTSFWHSLGIFSNADFTDIFKTINLEKINEVCLKTELVMVGAYDGEGYVFWEKNPTSGNVGFFE